jgi:FkbM family methyltransferase
VLVKPIDLSKYWAVFPSGVLHVGAHVGEEKELYTQAGWGPVIWIEAQPSLARALEKRFSASGDRVICATVWNENGIRFALNISSNSGSSSLLEFGSHKTSYPEISFTDSIEVVTSRLDSILSPTDTPNFMNLDIQGVELQALESLGKLMDRLDYIYVEINTKEVYEGCTKLSDLDQFLSKEGFKRVLTRRYIRHGWGEALFIRKNSNSQRLITLLPRIKNAMKFYSHQVRNLTRHIVKGTLND